MTRPDRARALLCIILVLSASLRILHGMDMMRALIGEDRLGYGPKFWAVEFALWLFAGIEIFCAIGLCIPVIAPLILQVLIVQSAIVLIVSASICEPAGCWFSIGAGVPLYWKVQLLSPLLISFIMAVVIILRARSVPQCSAVLLAFVFCCQETSCSSVENQDLVLVMSGVGGQVTQVSVQRLWIDSAPDADVVLHISSPCQIHSGMTGSPILDRTGKLRFIVEHFLGDTEEGVIEALDARPILDWFACQIQSFSSCTQATISSNKSCLRVGQTVGVSRWWGDYNSGCEIGVVCAVNSEFGLVMMKDAWQFPDQSVSTDCSLAILDAPLIGLGRDQAGPSPIYAPASIVGGACMLNGNMLLVRTRLPPAARLLVSVCSGPDLVFKKELSVCADQYHWKSWIEDCLKSGTSQVLMPLNSGGNADILLDGAKAASVTLCGSIGAEWRMTLIDNLREVLADQPVPPSQVEIIITERS